MGVISGYQACICGLAYNWVASTPAFQGVLASSGAIALTSSLLHKEISNAVYTFNPRIRCSQETWPFPNITDF